MQAVIAGYARSPFTFAKKGALATTRPDDVTTFGERDCLRGGLGQFQAAHLMLLAMAHAGKFGKYGA